MIFSTFTSEFSHLRPLPQPSLHIPLIDSLRGIAALSVCLHHFVCTTQNYVQDETVLGVFHFGLKGVQMFFIISGIVIPLSMIKGNYTYAVAGKFMAKRFIRLEPPYIAAVLLGIAYILFRNQVTGEGVQMPLPTVRDAALHLGYLVPFVEDAHWISPVFWTLSIEFQYYLFLAIAFPLVLHKRLELRALFYALLLCGPLLMENPNFFPDWGAYFALGVFYVLFRTGMIASAEYAIITAGAAALVWWHQGPVDLGLACATLLLIHFASGLDIPAGRKLGSISYSLYLLHPVFGAAFVNVLSHRFTAPHEKFFVIVGGLIVSILAAMLLYWLVERPAQTLSKRIRLGNAGKE